MRKISLVADASALVSLASVSLLPRVFNEFNVVVSDVVVQELSEMSTYADLYGTAASEVLRNIDRIKVKKTSNYQRFRTSRIDAGEASCMEIIESGNRIIY